MQQSAEAQKWSKRVSRDNKSLKMKRDPWIAVLAVSMFVLMLIFAVAGSV